MTIRDGSDTSLTWLDYTSNLTCCFLSLFVIVKTNDYVIKAFNVFDVIFDVPDCSLSSVLDGYYRPLRTKKFVSRHSIAFTFNDSEILPTLFEKLLSEQACTCHGPFKLKVFILYVSNLGPDLLVVYMIGVSMLSYLALSVVDNLDPVL